MSTDSRPSPGGRPDLVELLSRKVVGQPTAMQYIVPYIQMYQAGLAPTGRPAGIFLLLGPTGTGKTRTVEALADVLHGTEKNVLKIDCGEFQSDHEVAKLIGAPPGYLGHRETQPRLTQQKLNAVSSPECDLSLVLFDEIEKAAPSLTQLLLGILDKASLRLGDGSEVDFERSLIFLTSNLGAREMMKEISPEMGFRAASSRAKPDLAGKLEAISLAAVRRRFSPEFVNRIDVVVTYQPLDEAALALILDQHIAELKRHVHTRLGERSFEIEIADDARAFLLEKGASEEYGAREMKRTIHRYLTQPLAAMVAGGQIDLGARVTVARHQDGGALDLRAIAGPAAKTASPTPIVLVVDDNRGLLDWMASVLEPYGCRVLLADSARQAQEQMSAHEPDAAVFDYVLPDGDGVHLAVQLLRRSPVAQAIVVSGLDLSVEDAALCERFNIPTLQKPFLAQDILSALHAVLPHAGVAKKASASG